jgi:hypothetical protein
LASATIRIRKGRCNDLPGGRTLEVANPYAELFHAYQGALINSQLFFFELYIIAICSLNRARRLERAATVTIPMKIFFNPLHFVGRVFSKPDPEFSAKGAVFKDSAQSQRVLLVGFRSPGDQLHVVAIKPFQSNEESRSRPPFSSS